MRILSIVILLFAINLCKSEVLNYNGFLADTTSITDFSADSLKYGDPFVLSNYENTRITVAFDDTSSAGFASDSVKFYYFIQFGAPILNSSGKLDTTWDNNPIIIDTVDMLTAANFTTTYSALLSDGTYLETMGIIDSSSVSGYAVSSHCFPLAWNVWARVGVKGLTGNNVDSFIKLRIDRLARVGVKTKG